MISIEYVPALLKLVVYMVKVGGFAEVNVNIELSNAVVSVF